MGSCVSMYKDPKSAMKIRLIFSSKTDKLVNPSPIKDHNNKPLDNGDIKLHNPSVKLHQRSPLPPKTSFSDYGSREEAFFDSQAWLESDCDDDFYSVRGDFTPSVGNTPSRGNTPSHRGSSARNRTPFVERPASLPQSSPSIKRKKLFELFKDSIRHQNANDQDAEPNLNGTGADKEAKLSCLQLPPKSTSSTPVSRGKKTPNRAYKTEPNSPKSSQCCLPRLRSSGSFRGRSKSASPAHSVG